MRRTLAVLCLCAVAGLAGCGGSDNTSNGGNSNATRNGIIETNSNMNPRTNANSVPSNTAVVTNDNGNDNTMGVKPMNDNAGHSNANKGNANTKGNANH